MKNEKGKRLSEITSFRDFRIERENLEMRNKMIEARLKLSYMEITERFSLSNVLNTFSRDVVLPGISDLLGELIKRVEKNKNPGTENSPGN